MLKNRLRRLWSVAVVSAILALGGCYPQGATYVDELDMTVTVKNNEVNYDDYMTFYIHDTVALVSNNDDDEILDMDDAKFLVDEFRMRMLELGWQEVTTPQTDTPDVAILMTVLENVTTNIIGGGWGWGGWYGWGGWWGYPCCGYYPGYPGYCCYTSIYQYTTGSLIIEMLDVKNAEDQGDKVLVPVAWHGGLNGYAEGSQNNIRTRVKRSMDQMITDSPYLDKN